MEKGKEGRALISLEYFAGRELFTYTVSPTQFFVSLTRFIMDEDRRNWSFSPAQAPATDPAGVKLLPTTQLGIGMIRLPAGTEPEEILQLATSIRNSIRPLDSFSRMSENGFWILFHGAESGCKRAIERVEENFLATFDNAQKRRHLQSSLKVRLVMREPGQSRNEWIKKIDQLYFR